MGEKQELEQKIEMALMILKNKPRDDRDYQVYEEALKNMSSEYKRLYGEYYNYQQVNTFPNDS